MVTVKSSFRQAVMFLPIHGQRNVRAWHDAVLSAGKKERITPNYQYGPGEYARLQSLIPLFVLFGEIRR